MHRVVGQLRRIPLPLGLLLAAGVALHLTWVAFSPPWIGPDETGHFAYVQRMVEQREIPWFITGQPEDETTGTSSEVGTAVVQMGARAMDGNYAMKDVNRHPDEVVWEEAEAQLPSERKRNTDFMAPMLNPPALPALRGGAVRGDVEDGRLHARLRPAHVEPAADPRGDRLRVGLHRAARGPAAGRCRCWAPAWRCSTRSSSRRARSSTPTR